MSHLFFQHLCEIEMLRFFISYRTSDSFEESENIKHLLEKSIRNVYVFKDNYRIKLGENLAHTIVKHIEECDFFILLLHKNWLSHPHPSDPYLNRLDDPNDWIRQEVEIAISNDKYILPVLHKNATLPSLLAAKRCLPEPLQFLNKSLHYHEIRQISYSDDYKSLISKIIDIGGGQKIKKTHLTNNEFDINASISIPISNMLNDAFPLGSEYYESYLESELRPYVGLKPFSQKQAALFYGRTMEIYNICTLLQRDMRGQLLLLHGYSGVGKSSLLQAGIKARLSSIGLEPIYLRFEDLSKSKWEAISTTENQIVIIDQVEEFFTYGKSYKLNIKILYEWIERKLFESRSSRIILSFRSEYLSKITNDLSDYEINYIVRTVLPLNKNQMYEAIAGAALNRKLSRKFGFIFKNDDSIKNLINFFSSAKDSHYIAPIMQVNLLKLYENARIIKNKRVLHVDDPQKHLLTSYEQVLNYYIEQAISKIKFNVDRRLLLQLLNNFIVDEPSAASIPISKIHLGGQVSKNIINDIYETFKSLYILVETEADSSVARLSHDTVARVVRPMYMSYVELENAQLREENYNRKLKSIQNKILALNIDQTFDDIQFLLNSDISNLKILKIVVELLYFYSIIKDTQRINDAIFLYRQLSEANNLPTITKNNNVLKELESHFPKFYQIFNAKYFPNMKEIPEGDFEMGTISGRESEKPIHRVRISSFFISESPITFFQFYLYLRTKRISLDRYIVGWGFIGSHPVTKVNWYDCVGYCNWLSSYKNVDRCYDINLAEINDIDLLHEHIQDWKKITTFSFNGFRLPTEAEWEYASNGGNESKYLYAGSNDLTEVGWFDENSMNRTAPVMQKKPNVFGLYDMCGNVREWVFDRYDENYYKDSPNINPLGPVANNGYTVLRGGSYIIVPFGCRTTNRDFNFPNYRYNYYGFRVAQSNIKLHNRVGGPGR